MHSSANTSRLPYDSQTLSSRAPPRTVPPSGALVARAREGVREGVWESVRRGVRRGVCIIIYLFIYLIIYLKGIYIYIYIYVYIIQLYIQLYIQYSLFTIFRDFIIFTYMNLVYGNPDFIVFLLVFCFGDGDLKTVTTNSRTPAHAEPTCGNKNR